jgi:hypothetical protein
VVKWAVEERLADPKVVVADTTAMDRRRQAQGQGVPPVCQGQDESGGGPDGRGDDDPRREGTADARSDAAGRFRGIRGNVDAAAEVQEGGLGEADPSARDDGKLAPQIRYWLETGHVAANKLIILQIPELYAIVRGKVGKAVEFGLSWGITRLRGGFLLATLAKDKRELADARFAVRAVKDQVARFGKPPQAYAYDRGG